MKRDLIITIVKGDVSINCLYEGMGDLETAYKIIFNILENYNRNLLREEVPDELLLLRMFEMNDIYNTKSIMKPLLLRSSYNYLIKKYEKYNIDKKENRDKSYGEIAVTKYDLKKHESDTAGRIFIDIDKRTICIPDERMLFVKKIDQYCKLKGLDPDTFNSESLPSTDVYIHFMKFNDLEEIMGFLTLNKNGFMIDGLHYVHMINPNI